MTSAILFGARRLLLVVRPLKPMLSMALPRPAAPNLVREVLQPYKGVPPVRRDAFLYM